MVPESVRLLDLFGVQSTSPETSSVTTKETRVFGLHVQLRFLLAGAASPPCFCYEPIEAKLGDVTSPNQILTDDQQVPQD